MAMLAMKKRRSLEFLKKASLSSRIKPTFTEITSNTLEPFILEATKHGFKKSRVGRSKDAVLLGPHTVFKIGYAAREEAKALKSKRLKEYLHNMKSLRHFKLPRVVHTGDIDARAGEGWVEVERIRGRHPSRKDVRLLSSDLDRLFTHTGIGDIRSENIVVQGRRDRKPKKVYLIDLDQGARIKKKRKR